MHPITLEEKLILKPNVQLNKQNQIGNQVNSVDRILYYRLLYMLWEKKRSEK